MMCITWNLANRKWTWLLHGVFMTGHYFPSMYDGEGRRGLRQAGGRGGIGRGRNARRRDGWRWRGRQESWGRGEVGGGRKARRGEGRRGRGVGGVEHRLYRSCRAGKASAAAPRRGLLAARGDGNALHKHTRGAARCMDRRRKYYAFRITK